MNWLNSNQPQTSQRLAGLQLLLVEDQQDIRELFMFVLESEGAEVLFAETVEEALNLLEMTDPDLLITNIQLPDGDGYALVQTLRAKEGRSKNIPAIAVTGAVAGLDSDHIAAAGFQGFLAKPVEPDSLIAIVAGLTGREQLAQESRKQALEPETPNL